MTFTKNIQEAFGASGDEQDRGTLVETVLLLAGFAVVTILVVTWIGNAVAGAAADTANCISGSNSYAAGSAQEACSTESKHNAKAKTDNETSMKERFKTT